MTDKLIPASEKPKGLPLDIIVKRVARYWPIITLAFLLSILSAFIYLRYAVEVYKVQARVVVNDDDQQRSNSNLLRFQFDGSGIANETEKEVEILKSRTLLSDVVSKLSLQAIFFRAGNVKKGHLYGGNQPVSIELKNPTQITNTFSGPVNVKNNGKTIQYLGVDYPVDSIVNAPFGDCIWHVDLTVKGGEEDLELQIVPIRLAVAAIKERLSVSPISSQSSIIDLVLLDESSLRGMEILKTLLDLYSVNYVDFQRRIAQNTLRFIDDRLILISEELNDVEKNLEKFKRSEGVVDLSIEGQLFLNKVAQTDQQIAELGVQLQTLGELRNYVSRRNADAKAAPATLGLQDPVLQGLLTQLFETEFKLEETSRLSGAKNPQLEVLQNQVVSLRQSIHESIGNLEDKIKKNISSLKYSNSQNESQLKRIPQKERLLIDISRQQAIKNTIYTFLLQRREEAAIQSASIVPNTRIIDQPQSFGVEKPKSILVYATFIVLFLLTSFAIVFFKEFANSKFLYKKELEEATGIPVIGELQQVTSSDLQETGIIFNNKRSIINEQFRELRTNLNFLKKGNGAQTILLTSSKSGEGKSFVSINLGASIAQMGKRAIILELDLRKPKVLHYLGLDRGNGISNYLIGDVSIKSIIRPVKDAENLFVIGAGPLPPNPAELLLSERLNDLFENLKKEFDYIIIDAPPVGLVIDARLAGKYADACLYLVRYNYTERIFGDFIIESNKRGDLPPINLVFNYVPINRTLGYNYGYAYGYGYGYFDESDKKGGNSLLNMVKGKFKS